MPKSKPIALYARVSTAAQDPGGQLRRLRQYGEARGTEAVEYVDHGVSGGKDSRPALDALLEACGRRELSAVAVVKLDRLARSTRHLCNLAADFEALGVALVVLDQSINTSTPTGRLLFNVLGAIGEFERDLIRDRVSAGLEHARAKGKRLGRPPALDAKGVARARRLRASGKSWREVGRLLGVNHSTVIQALKRAS